jgi:hypothetical protein
MNDAAGGGTGGTGSGVLLLPQAKSKKNKHIPV